MRRLIGNIIGSFVYSLVLAGVSLWLVAQGVLGLLFAILPLKAVHWARRRFGPGEPGAHRGPGWQNAVGNQFSDAGRRKIRNLDGLVSAVRETAKRGGRIRAGGSGHSFSDVAVNDDVMLDLHHMNADLGVDLSVLKQVADGRRFVEIESGMRIRELNRHLERKRLALFNMGAFDGQTISGAISTATHGSGRSLGALCDAVRSLVLVTEDGQRRLEPTAGITDPVRYLAKHPDGPALTQDDELFHSTVVAMGCMGIVYSYILEVRPRYLLEESRELVSWTELRKKLIANDFTPCEQGRTNGEVRHFELLVNPYPRRNGERDCLLTCRWEVADRPKGDSAARSRNPIATFVTGIRQFDRVIALILTSFPSAARFLLGAALRSLVDRKFVARSYEVLNLGSPNHVPAYAQELAFDAGCSDGAEPEYLRALDLLFELAGEQAKHGRWHTVPMSVRFIQKSPHFLAMSYGRPTAIVEIGMLAGAPAGWELLRFYERRLFQSFRARPHWGQANFVLGPDRVRAMYPAFDRWLASYARLCPRGIFENSFTERLGLRTLVDGWPHLAGTVATGFAGAAVPPPPS